MTHFMKRTSFRIAASLGLCAFPLAAADLTFFTVNVRRPEYAGKRVKLTGRENGPPMKSTWDGMLTLEFNGAHPGVSALKITPNPEAVTVFLAGDSTVTDQVNEPWAGWGQMLPAFFGAGVAVSNHAESGLTLRSFAYQGRLDKVLSMMKKGDYLFIQFGHNDQKDKSAGAGPFTTYKEKLVEYVKAVRKKGGIPVLVTPVERRRWSGGKPQATLADFAEAVRQAGREQNVPVIDLNAKSLDTYAALGDEGTRRAFVHFPAHTFPGQDTALRDDSHHSNFGGYLLARCMVRGIRDELPELAAHLRPGIGECDPSKPATLEAASIPPNPVKLTPEKPAGD